MTDWIIMSISPYAQKMGQLIASVTTSTATRWEVLARGLARAALSAGSSTLLCAVAYARGFQYCCNFGLNGSNHDKTRYTMLHRHSATE